MTTDNILVSREKWEKIVNFISWSNAVCQDDRSTEILNMPDFIESDRDRIHVACAISYAVSKHPTEQDITRAGSVIKALQTKSRNTENDR